MNRRILTTLTLLLSLVCTSQLRAAPPADSARTKLNFNSGWLVNVGDVPGAEAPAFAGTEWKKVTLPYAWNEDSAFKVSLADSGL